MFDLLIDNTSLHSAFRSIDGIAETENDVRSLLQLATQIVFSDTVQLCTYESEGVSNRTALILNTAHEMGLKNLAVLHDVSEIYHECGRAIGDEIASEWMDGQNIFAALSNVKVDEMDIAPDAVKGLMSWKKQHNVLTKIRNISGREREEICLDAQSGKADKIVTYVSHASESLFDRLRYFQGDNIWQVSHTQFLIHLIRLRLYQELAERETLRRGLYIAYSPAVIRAQIAQEYDNMLGSGLPELLMELTDDAVIAKNGFLHPKFPSVWIALIVRGRAEPKGILEEAYRLNEAMAGLRSSIRLNVPIDGLASHDTAMKTENYVKSLAGPLLRVLNEQSGDARLGAMGKVIRNVEAESAIDLSCYIGKIATGSMDGIVSPLISATSTNLKNKRKFSALTDIVGANVWAKRNGPKLRKLYTRLKSNSVKNL